MNQLEQEQLLQRPPLAPRCHGGERERERSRPAICRKNYRPGLIKLFDRLEADTEGRKEGGPRLGIILRQRRRPSNLVLEGADTHTYYILQTFRVGSAGGGGWEEGIQQVCHIQLGTTHPYFGTEPHFTMRRATLCATDRGNGEGLSPSYL